MIDPRWRKSSYSDYGGECVEVAAADHVLLRDTRDRTGPVLRFTPQEWRRFTHCLISAAQQRAFWFVFAGWCIGVLGATIAHHMYRR